MSQRRTLILVAAILIGAVASFLVWNYVKGVKDDAYANTKRVEVFLVRGNIARGTGGTEAQAMIVKSTIPAEFRPSNAVASLEDIVGKVAVNDLVPNQVLVSDMFVSPSDPLAQASFSEKLKQIGGVDMVSATVRVNDTNGVAGLIRPGDYVNVLVLPSEGQTGDRGGEEGTPEGQQPSAGIGAGTGSRYLTQKVRVLAVGRETTPEPGAVTEDSTTTPTDTGLVTLIVPVDTAQQLMAIDPSKIYLSLVARDYVPVPQPPTDLTGVWPGEDPNKMTPYGPEGETAG